MSPPRRNRTLQRPLSRPLLPPPAKPERLQKLLAAAGLGSRRAIEAWIEAGRVTVDGRVATLGEKAGPGSRVAVDGKEVAFTRNASFRVLVYHKPVGELVTRSDPQGRPTVFSRLPPGRWVAVGRLDFNTSGLLLLTDSGELANRLMHPRHEVLRVYRARVHGLRDETKLKAGIQLDDGPAAFESVVAEGPATGANRWYRVALREGRNREVRRIFEAAGAQVSRLVRIRYGPLELPGDLAPGSWREIKNPVILQKL